MNFLKKKIKGHKRGGPESDEVEAAIYAKQLAEGQQPQQPPEAKERTGEEWRFFEQLTQRVQDTVHKTQTTLSKIKESSAITELTRPDYYLEPTAAPPEQPASPARSWVNFEESEGAEAPGPSAEPAKEPVGDLVKDLVSEPEGALVSEPVSSPPEAQPAGDEDQARKLLEEFGFGIEEPPAPPPSNAPHLDLLSGFGIEEPQPSEAHHIDVSDPFDTSFVDTLASSTEPDPFDTSFVDSCVAAKEAPPAGADGSEASPEMSNPFLTDVSATTGESLFSTGDTGDVAPDVPNFFSGSRRSSTNPFDNLEEDLAFFQATLVGAAEADATQREASDLLQDIAATFPCESEDAAPLPSNGDPFKCSETVQQQPVPETAAAAPDAFQVAFGKASFDRGLSPDKCGLSGGAFDDTSPEEAGGSPAEPIGSFDPFSDLSRESQEPIPAALASITPQREDVSPFSIAPSDKQEQPAATDSKPELFADFGTNEVPPASAECDFFGKDSGATSAVIASDDPFCSGSVASPPMTVRLLLPKRRATDIFGTSSLSGTVAAGSDPFRTTDVTAAKSVVSDGHDLFDTSDAADPAATIANGFGSVGAPVAPASDDPFQTSGAAASTLAGGDSLFDTSDIAAGAASDDPFSASNIDATVHPPGADPFDTSNIQLEPAKNAVPFTDTAAFEAFAAKFEQAIEKFEDATLAPAFEELDQQSVQEDGDDAGFDSMDIFDPFAPKAPPPPKASPRVPVKEVSQDSFDD
ncbi:hypothetical protein HPB52_008586 [Rhipicephalus sanguineus]|uniref:Uncharacterized protein n=1 Tax=Rhipicephalus sanguineus TaxID=34632 RepID=A0A9D4Q9E9_RHISA|nr:hypothetical protein HPB52_008586 [Rhipicephalus sanguineus]